MKIKLTLNSTDIFHQLFKVCIDFKQLLSTWMTLIVLSLV